jgi:hypothetical protein
MLKNTAKNKGFTIIEMMVGAAAAVIVVLGTAIALSDSQRGYNETYNRVYSDVVTGSHIAQRTFESVVRKSSTQWVQLDSGKNWVEVYYYSDPNSSTVDSYARFYIAENSLYVEYGNRDPREALNTETICKNITSCEFQTTGRSIQMILTVDNGREKLTTTTSATLHN